MHITGKVASKRQLSSIKHWAKKMIITENDKLYAIVRGSDIERDGMYLELSRNDMKSDSPLAEIFYSDKTEEMLFMSHSKEPIPLPVLRRFIEESKNLIPLSKTKEKE